MDFKERFKGKTSTISKEGIESVISTSATPIKKEFIPLASTPLPLISSATSILLDHSPKQKPPLKSTTNQKSESSIRVSGFERITPKANTFTFGSHIYSFQPQPMQSTQQRPSFLLNRLTEMSPGRDSRVQQSPLLFRENQTSSKDSILNFRDHNGSPIVHSHSDLSSNSFNPNNFYNQQTQLRTNKDGREIRTQKSLNDVISRSPDHLLNKNQIHKKNFETLNQQNKQRQLSQETGKGLVSKNQLQQYFNVPYLEEGRESRNYVNNSPLRTERAGTLSPVRSMNTPMLYDFTEEEKFRENQYYGEYSQLNHRNSLSKADKVSKVVLNKLRYRVPDSGNLNGYQGRINESGNCYEIRKEGGSITPMKQVQENIRFGNFQSISDIFVGKHNSEGSQLKGKKQDPRKLISLVHPTRLKA